MAERDEQDERDRDIELKVRAAISPSGVMTGRNALANFRRERGR